MIYRRRNGEEVLKNEKQDQLLKQLYLTTMGRFVLKVLVQPWVSKLGGAFLNSRFSALFITSFIEKNRIAMSQYQCADYDSYNKFFHRRINRGMRPIDRTPDRFISPCDAKLMVYPIDDNKSFCIKQQYYTIERLLRDKKLADQYKEGLMLVFRLTVDDYHHYCYVADGRKTRNIRVPGILHTVNPIAQELVPVYAENSREYCVLKSDQFGPVLTMEVGALMVGKIVNLHEKAVVWRGQEKGWFEFGGSTIILLVKKDILKIDHDILQNSKEGIETIVHLGESIAQKKC